MPLIFISIILLSAAVQSTFAARKSCPTCQLASRLDDQLSSRDIEVHDDGTFTYTPPHDFDGTDTFPVTVNDDVNIHIHGWDNINVQIPDSLK